MLATRQFSLAGSLVLLSLLACDRNPPLAPSFAASKGSVTGGAPTNLTATAASSHQIWLAWQDNSTKETGFEVHRSTTGANGALSLLAVASANGTSYSDAGLSTSTQYCYKVRAFRTYDSKTSYSSFSNITCATTLGPPPAAGAVVAVPRSSSLIEVLWIDNSAIEVGFRVEHSSDGATWTAVATTAADATQYWEAGRPSEQQTCYRVIGVYADGESPPSNVACAIPPAAPSDLVARVLDHQTVELQWTDNSSVEDGYQVWRYRDGWGWEVAASLPANSASHRDIVLSNILYSYYIVATREVGRSTGSNIVTAFAPTNPPSAPPAPPVIWWVDPYAWFISIWWLDNSDNEAGFKVERCEGIVCSDADFTMIAVLGTNTSQTYGEDYYIADGSYVPGTTYTYRVRAFNNIGDSAPSSTVSATACYLGIDEEGFYYCATEPPPS